MTPHLLIYILEKPPNLLSLTQYLTSYMSENADNSLLSIASPQ